MFLNSGLNYMLIDEHDSVRAMKQVLRLSDISEKDKGNEVSAQECTSLAQERIPGGFDMSKSDAFLRLVHCVVCTNLLRYDTGVRQCIDCNNHLLCSQCAKSCANKCPFCDKSSQDVFAAPSK